MERLTSVILYAFSCSFAGTDERVLLDRGDAQWSLKLGAGIYVSYPLFNALVTFCAVLVMLGADANYAFWLPLMIGFWVIIVLVDVLTSKVYNDNIETIWEQGHEMRTDPNRGPKWARRRTGAFLIANSAYFLVSIWIIL